MNQASNKRASSDSEEKLPYLDPGVLGCATLIAVFVLFLIANWQWSALAAEQNLATQLTEFQSVFHENLARSLEHEGKFELNFADDDWTAPYLESSLNQGVNNDWIFTYDANGQTSSHFPAIPVINYLAFQLGSEGLGATIAGLVLAFALALLVVGVNKWFGKAAAFICMLFLLLDSMLHCSPHYESMDGLLTGLIVLAFVAIVSGLHATPESGRRVIWRFPVAGVLLGVTTLFQLQQNLWLVFLLAAWIGCLAFRLVKRKSMVRFFEGSLLFAIGLMVVAAPWWVRNCKITGQLKPLGHAVHSNIVGAYSNAALDSRGNLNIDEILRYRLEQLEPLGLEEMELLELEELIAKSSWEESSSWFAENSELVPALLVDRLLNHLGMTRSTLMLDSVVVRVAGVTVLLMGFLGCFLCWPRFGGIVFAVFLASVLTVVMTWSDDGRFLIPVRPLLMASAAIGLAAITKRFSSRSAREPVANCTAGSSELG